MTGRPRPERPGDVIPEPMEFAGWPPLGASSAELRAGPLELRLRRADRDALDSLARWAGAERAAGEPWAAIEIELTRAERERYLADPQPGEPLRLEVWSEPHGGFAAVTHHAALLLDAACERGLAVLTRQPPERLDLSLQNLLRVAAAWALARRGAGLLLHAAAVERGGRAVLLLGHSGAGKTTAARLAEADSVLADDAALLTAPEREGEPWLVHPGPLWAEPGFPGRRSGGGAVPLALACSLRHGAAASFERLPRSRAAVVAASCAPFLGASPEAFDPSAAAGAFARSVPAGVLTFAKDEPWWPAVAEILDRASPARPTEES